MKGYVATIPVSGPITVVECNGPVPLDILQRGVGGYIEVVPFFDKFSYEGTTYPAVAFCDEEGKLMGKPINTQATHNWWDLVPVMNDVLVGNVVVVFGDKAFLAAL